MRHGVYETIIFIILLCVVLCIPRYRNVLFFVGNRVDGVGVSPSQRNQGIDFLKGSAVLAVILIHVIYFALAQVLTLTDVYIINLLNAMLRFAIGGFLIASGYLLRSPQVWFSRDGLMFYWKKIVRIGIPYGLVTYLLWLIESPESSLGKLLLTGTASVPLYFVPVLFQLYLIYPLLDGLRKKYPYMLLIGSFALSVFSFLTGYLYTAGGMVLCTQFLFFFVYGMTIGDQLSNVSREWRKYLEILFIYVGAHSIVALRYLTLEFNPADPLVTHVYNTQLVYAIVMTQLLVFLGTHYHSRWFQSIRWCGKMSLWIFLLHFPIQNALYSPSYQASPNLVSAMIVHGIMTLSVTGVFTIIVAALYSTMIQKSAKLVENQTH